MTTHTVPQKITRGIYQSYLLFDQDYVVAAGLQELLMGMGNAGKNLRKNLGASKQTPIPLKLSN